MSERSRSRSYMYTYHCHFFFFLRTHLFVLAPSPETVRGWARFDRWGHVAGGLDAIRAVCRDLCSVSRVASLLNFLASGTDKANPRVSATSPGIGLLHPLSPCTHVRFGCTPVFPARSGYTYISLFLHRASRYDPAAQQQSSPLAAAACDSIARVAAVIVADCFDRSL